ncbi:methyltransferase [Sanguibacteroides justesenii]|uniref:Methyltransferase n=2 Tax=Porphyromonadaceae TaxID=171551 RepID=A0AB34R1H5_9PORP|nr:methyltransferase [Sanguibacteroides justesenii]
MFILMIVLQPIGYVSNKCTTDQVPEQIKQEASVIEILPEYGDGLDKIETCRYLDIVFYFHQNHDIHLTGKIRTGETKGVFASRSPNRPNHLGITTVKLMKREGNRLYIEGIDALNGSPVVDIKSCDTSVYDQENIHKTIRVDSPRIDIVRNIMSNNLKELLLQSAQLHGHICPGLALGVMGAARIMQQLYDRQQDTVRYTLTAGMENCLVDGFMFVTGCTPGTRRFRTGDKNDMCFYLRDESGKGWRIKLKESNRDYMKKHIPESFSPAEKAFAVFELDFDKLFEIEAINN